MNFRTPLITAFLIACATAPQDPVHFEVRGTMIDDNTRRPIRGAQVHIEHSTLGAVTDSAGTFAISALGRPGTYKLIARFIGYATATRRIKVSGSSSIIQIPVIGMQQVPIQIDDFVVGICSQYRSPPADTAGASVRVLNDSAGRYWEVCRRP